MSVRPFFSARVRVLPRTRVPRVWQTARLHGDSQSHLAEATEEKTETTRGKEAEATTTATATETWPEPQTDTVPLKIPRPRKDPIPFELPADIAQELQSEREADEGGPRGTITPEERRVFGRIFGELAAAAEETGGDATAGTSKSGEASATTASSAASSASSPPLDTPSRQAWVRRILREASSSAAHRDSRSTAQRTLRARHRQIQAEKQADAAGSTVDRSREMLARLPPSLRSAAATAMGIQEEGTGLAGEESRKRESEAAAPSPEQLALAQKAAQIRQQHDAERRQRQARMEKLMLRQKTDFELWDYLEEHVFTMVAELGLGGESSSKGSSRGQSFLSPSTTPPSSPLSSPFSSTSSVPPSPASSVPPLSPSSPPRPLSVDGPLYPALLLHALRLFDGHFSTGQACSPLALALLPRVKSLGLASYVLGAGTPFYNALLRIHWLRFGDARAVFVLLHEMRRAGLAFDTETLQVLRSMEWQVVPLAAGGAGAGSSDKRWRLSIPGARLGPAAYESGASLGPALSAGFSLRGAIHGLPSPSPSSSSSGIRQAATLVPDIADVPALLAYWRPLIERSINDIDVKRVRT